jgi:hypothetical protein
MSEPPSISRRATAWWPAVVALEQVMDAGTATALAVSRGAQVSPSGVRQLCDAVRALLGVLGTGERLTVLGRAGRGRLVGWPWSRWPFRIGRAGRIRTGDLRDPKLL